MFNVFRKEIDFAGKTLVLETGKIARQADASVMASIGGTSVLCTVTAAKSIREGQDFFPLSVHYTEKYYASGRIPGGFLKREGRPTDVDTLTSRLIDRPIRPLFPSWFLNETQVICTVVSHDLENAADIVAMAGVSAALTLSGLPFMGPIGACRIGYKDGEYIINPTHPEMEGSDLDLVVAGTKEGVLMVESEAQELSEETMLGAVVAGQKAYDSIIDGVIELAEMAAKDPWDEVEEDAAVTKMAQELAKTFKDDIAKAYGIKIKQERQDALKELKNKAIEQFASDEEGGIQDTIVLSKFKKVEADVVRSQILETKGRIDGRTTTDIRPIVAETGVLPQVHGSALFTRGETQALVVTTLGTGQDEQMIDGLFGESYERFMLHYNFPPYSVGETGRMGSPGRREIGHGKLAWRAIHPLLPHPDQFPYTLRVVSEITESNGSSSMATVCGTSLALMDAGVPLPKPVAGIAMGLIKEDDKFAVLSDILGDEDHLGDMDFKVAGTRDGITALQMDIKITSITEEIMKIALGQAKDGRMHILGEMAKAMDTARADLNANAPRVETMKINVEKIRDVIGTGGKVIREICETTGAKLDVEEDGLIKIYGPDKATIDAAYKMVHDIVAEPEVGTIYRGKVVKIMDFGAFVNFLGKSDGLVHVSAIKNERVENVGDELEEGDMVYVKLLSVDDRGKFKLSMKHVDQTTGQEIKKEEEDAA